MKQHLPYIDNLKGFLILLVVLGHCIQNTDADFDHNIVFRYIYSFHMPLFMCISGFVSYKPHTEWLTVRKRFVQLIIPFLAWAILVSCIKWNFSAFPDKILHPDTGLWFLWALFFIVLILKLCEDTARRIGVRSEYVIVACSLIMVGIMVVLKFKLFGFQFIAWYFIFYCMGYFGKKYEDKIRRFGKSTAWILLAIFVTAAYYWMRKDPPTFMPTESSMIYNYAYKLIVATIACTAFISLFKHHVNHNLLIINKLWGGG